jgi:hypothetical protein
MQCYWCGRDVGHSAVEMPVGNAKKVFHRGLLKDCYNEFSKWTKTHENEPRLRLLEAINTFRKY